MRDRPRIAVTTSERSGWRIFPLVAFNLWLSGGRGVRWRVGRPADLAEVDGLIIGGGDDISPDIYGGELVASARLDPDRDAMERELAIAAIDAGMPLLGICRGSQMINVALGGTLHQQAYDVYKASDHYWTVLPKKEVSVLPETQLMRIAGPEPMRVNALHSQAVNELGAHLQVSARDRGGMAQAIERTDGRFAMGVQWHPEHLFYARRQRALFRALTEAATEYARVNRAMPAARVEA